MRQIDCRFCKLLNQNKRYWQNNKLPVSPQLIDSWSTKYILHTKDVWSLSLSHTFVLLLKNIHAVVGFITDLAPNCVCECFARELACSSIVGSRNGGVAVLSTGLLNFAGGVCITLLGIKKKIGIMALISLVGEGRAHCRVLCSSWESSAPFPCWKSMEFGRGSVPVNLLEHWCFWEQGAVWHLVLNDVTNPSQWQSSSLERGWVCLWRTEANGCQTHWDWEAGEQEGSSSSPPDSLAGTCFFVQLLWLHRVGGA